MQHVRLRLPTLPPVRGRSEVQSALLHPNSLVGPFLFPELLRACTPACPLRSPSGGTGAGRLRTYGLSKQIGVALDSQEIAPGVIVPVILSPTSSNNGDPPS